MTLKTGYKRTAFIAIAFVALVTPLAAHAFFFGPSNYDECIQKRLKPGMSDIQSRAIIRTCRNEFPSNDSSDREKLECANGAGFSNPHISYKRYSIDQEHSEWLDGIDVFDNYSLSFYRLIDNIDIISTEWKSPTYLNDSKRYLITMTNRLDFDIHGISVEFGPEGSKCGEMPIVYECTGSISAKRTGIMDCPSPPYNSFSYCFNSVAYYGSDAGKMIAALMGTECSIVDK